MIKKIISIVGIVLVGMIGILVMRKQAHRRRTTIGILQTASHKALDAVRQGVIDEVQKLFGFDVAIDYQNAEGALHVAHTMAQKLHNDQNVKAIVTIGTLASQAIIKVEKHKPIIYTAVTDVHGIGIDPDQTNVCGISDKIDVQKIVDTLILLIPAAKKIGILYNPSETNSNYLVNEATIILKERKLDPIVIGANSELEMPLAAAMVCKKADVLLLPTDNTVAATLKLIVSQANKNKIPIIGGVDLWVQEGILASAGGVDYRQSGSVAAHYIKQMLVDHKNPKTITTENSVNPQIVLNKQSIKKLNITLPQTKSNILVIK